MALVLFECRRNLAESLIDSILDELHDDAKLKGIMEGAKKAARIYHSDANDEALREENVRMGYAYVFMLFTIGAFQSSMLSLRLNFRKIRYLETDLSSLID